MNAKNKQIIPQTTRSGQAGILSYHTSFVNPL